MPEQNLSVTQNGQYRNISLKPRKGVGGLEVGNYTDLTKTYLEGMPIVSKIYTNSKGEPTVSYGVKANYSGEEVSFFLNEAEHNLWKQTGGIGDTLRVTMTEETVLNRKTNVKMILPRLTFELVG